MKIDLSFEHSGSSPDNPQELVNMFVESDASGGESQYIVIGTPGLVEYKDTGASGTNRGGHILSDGTLLTVIDTTLYKITAGLVQTSIGTISGVGEVQFAENTTQVMIINENGNGYVYTIATSALASISYNISPVSITFQDLYGIAAVNDIDTGSEPGRIYISAINDFTSWDPLDFITDEAQPDPIVAIFSDHNDVWAFGERGSTAYYNSGSSSFPFARRSGATLEIGCASPYSVAKGENIMFWLDDKGFVRKAEGYQPIIISTRRLERDIADKDWSTAKGFTYAQDGHTFYVLIFSDVCWVYDMSTQKWHQRSGLNGVWRAAWVRQYGNRILAGDIVNGKIYSMSTSAFTDNGDEIRSVVTTLPVHSDRKRIKHKKLELHMETGAGPGQVMMTYSDDGGKTWSNERTREFGGLGEYSIRVQWHRLGMARNRVYKFAITSSLSRKLISAHVEVEASAV